MTLRVTIISVVLLALLSIGAYFVLRNDDSFVPPNNTPPLTQNSLIRVASPLPNATITSPVTVTGEARGNWYFEASFPIEILDANGKRLGVGIGEAQGEWMTENFVPFRAEINFFVSTTSTGFIVLHKDNPSDMRELDEEVRVPIRFSQVVSETRDIKLYFYNNQNDRDASGNIICSAKGLVPFNRTIPFTNTPIQDAVKELLKGPSNIEKLTTPGTEFPIPGLTLTSASVTNSVLTLILNDSQGKTAGGSCRVEILRAQIEATAKQFGGVSSVRLMPEGAFQP